MMENVSPLRTAEQIQTPAPAKESSLPAQVAGRKTSSNKTIQALLEKKYAARAEAPPAQSTPIQTKEEQLKKEESIKENDGPPPKNLRECMAKVVTAAKEGHGEEVKDLSPEKKIMYMSDSTTLAMLGITKNEEIPKAPLPQSKAKSKGARPKEALHQPRQPLKKGEFDPLRPLKQAIKPDERDIGEKSTPQTRAAFAKEVARNKKEAAVEAKKADDIYKLRTTEEKRDIFSKKSQRASVSLPKPVKEKAAPDEKPPAEAA